jgi:hypothetical protein
MNTMQPKKSQTTQNDLTQALWAELGDDVAAQLSGGGPRRGSDRIVVPTDGDILSGFLDRY